MSTSQHEAWAAVAQRPSTQAHPQVRCIVEACTQQETPGLSSKLARWPWRAQSTTPRASKEL